MSTIQFRLTWRAIRQINCLGVAGLLVGCVSIADVDVTKYEPTCARECTGRHSACVSGSAIATGPQLMQCKEGFQLCLRTCPSRQ